MMTSAQVVETSVTTTDNSPYQDYTHPDDQTKILNYLVLRIVKALPFIHQPDRVARKASDESVADWRYQTHVKKYRK